ncbi:MAG: NUDIX hydrolase [Lacipirellulaceae bacterium]
MTTNDHRAPLLAMLAEYALRTPEEADVAERIAALVAGHADCFDRACRPGHVTGSAWIVSPPRDRVLLLHHRKLGRWLQPGGHADGDPDVARVALKEATEETGLASLRLLSATPIDLDVHVIPARRAPDGAPLDDQHEHHDVRFLVEADPAEPLAVNDESHAVRWFTPDEVRGLTQEWSVLRLLAKGRAAETRRTRFSHLGERTE